MLLRFINFENVFLGPWTSSMSSHLATDAPTKVTPISPSMNIFHPSPKTILSWPMSNIIATFFCHNTWCHHIWPPTPWRTYYLLPCYTCCWVPLWLFPSFPNHHPLVSTHITRSYLDLSERIYGVTCPWGVTGPWGVTVLLTLITTLFVCQKFIKKIWMEST